MRQKYYKIGNHGAFEVKYLGATNTRGSRVKITDLRARPTTKSKIISYDYELDTIGEMALNYLNSIGFKIKFKVCLEKVDLLITDDFKRELV